MAKYDQNINTLQNHNYTSCEILDYIDNDIRKYFNDFTLEKHEICKPPDEAYLFFPKEEELYEPNEINESKVFRKIFGVKKFTEYETEILGKFEAFIGNFNEPNENRQIVFTEDWERWDTLKFLEAANYEFKKALQNISNYIDWRFVYFPFELSDKAIEILAFSGFIYCHGRDHNYRPNVFLKVDIYFTNYYKYSFDDWQMALVFFCEYVIKFMLIPGQVEQWNIFIDLENLSLVTVSEDMEKLIKFLKEFYVSRVNLIYVFSMSKRLEGLYKLILTLLEPSTKNKIIFINENNKEEIFAHCNKEQIEQKYGGAAKNLYETVNDLEKNLQQLRNNLSNSSIDISNSSESNIIYFFPPIIPSKDFRYLLRKKYSKSLDKENSLGKISNKNKLSPNINCASVNIFSTPKINASKNNVFIYNPNNYKCIQMSELAGIDRNPSLDKFTPGIDKRSFAKFSSDNVRRPNEAREIPSKLVPKPLNLKEISETKKTFNTETRSQTLKVNNSSSILNRTRKEEKELIDKIIEKDEEYDSSLYEDAISSITVRTQNVNEGETSSNMQVKLTQRRTSSNLFYTARDINELTNSSNLNSDKSGKNFFDNIRRNRSSKNILLDFDDRSDKTVSDRNATNNATNNANSLKDLISSNNSKEKNKNAQNENLNFNKSNKTQDSYRSDISIHQHKYEDGAESHKIIENSFDLLCDTNLKDKKISRNTNNNNNLNVSNNSKLANENRYSSNNVHKLSTILEDNEILNHISMNSKTAYHASNEDTSDINERNNAFNNDKRHNNNKNKKAKSESKNKNKDYLNSENNSDRLNEILHNKINININNNININFNVNNINNVSEQYMNRTQGSPGDFNDKMKFFMNRTMRCERSFGIKLANEDSSSEGNSKFGSKYANSQSHSDIKNKSYGESKKTEVNKPVGKTKENSFKEINEDSKKKIQKNENLINSKLENVESRVSKHEQKEKEAVTDNVKFNEINEVKRKTENTTVDKKAENTFIKNPNDSNFNKQPETLNNKNETADSKPKNDRANNFANFFQRLNKTSQLANSNISNSKLNEEVIKKEEHSAKPEDSNQPQKTSVEILNKKVELNDKKINDIEFPLKEEKAIEIKSPVMNKKEDNENMQFKTEEKISTKDENFSSVKIKLSREAISSKQQQNNLEAEIFNLKNKEIKEKKEEANKEQMSQEIKENLMRESSSKAQSFIVIDPIIENKNDEKTLKFENIKMKADILEENNPEERNNSPHQNDCLNANFKQNEIRQNLKLENKLAKENTKQRSSRNILSLNKNNNVENQASKDASHKIFEELNNQFNTENKNNKKSFNKTNSAQSFDLEPNKEQGLLTSREHVVSVEEEINRCLMLRRKEKSEINMQSSNVLNEKFTSQLKDKLCKQNKIKMYNLKLTKTPIMNSSNTWEKNKINSNFGLNNQNDANENEDLLDSPCFKTINETALWKANANNDDNSKRDLCHKELAKKSLKQKDKQNVLVSEDEKKASKSKVNNFSFNKKNENFISLEDDRNLNFNLNGNVDQIYFDEPIRDEVFDDILTDEVNEGENLKDSVFFKMKNELSISKNKFDKISLNVDSIEKFSFNKYNESKNQIKRGGNLPNKTNSLNNSSKSELELEIKNFEISSNNINSNNTVNRPIKRRTIGESFFNTNNQNKVIKSSTFKKTLDNENFLGSVHNEDYVSNNEFGTNKPILQNNLNNCNDNSHNNYSNLLPNSGNNNANNYSLNTENILNTDIIMDRVIKQPCCSNLNVEDKCLIF